ncbi:MAG TPA: hypothetical protein VIX12_01385 [Candidatus Binataceae bacterium]
MLYIVGGAPRAGKSILARQMLAEHHLPYFSVDTLMMGIAKGMPEFGLRLCDPALKRAGPLWPIVRGMAESFVERGDDYLLEGDVILPSHIVELDSKFSPGIRSCFIGYALIDPVKKMRAIRSYAAGKTDWTQELDDADLLELIGELKGFSDYLRRECCRYRLPYFDGSARFSKALREASAHLRS